MSNDFTKAAEAPSYVTEAAFGEFAKRVSEAFGTIGAKLNELEGVVGDSAAAFKEVVALSTENRELRILITRAQQANQNQVQTIERLTAALEECQNREGDSGVSGSDQG